MVSELTIGGLEVSLRKATPNDQGFVYELMHSSLARCFDAFTQEKWSRKKFKQGYKPDRITIVEHEGMPIGFYDIEIVGREAYVHNLHVSKDYRNGFGIQLMRYLDTELKNKRFGSSKAKVFNECKMIPILKRLFGYKELRQVPEENSVIMIKTWN